MPIPDFHFHMPGEEVLVRVPMIEHLWPSRSSGLLLGPDKSAKSTYALEEALCLVHRWPVLGRYTVPQQQRVLFVTEEDDTVRMERRVLDLLRLHRPELLVDTQALAVFRELTRDGRFVLMVKPRLNLHDVDHVAELVRVVTEHQFDVIYLDALGAMTGQRLSNEHDAGALVEALRKIEATGAVLRIIHHTAKLRAKGYTPDTATVRDGSGHHAIADWARASLLFSRRRMTIVEPGPDPVRVVEVPSLLRFEGSDGAPAKLGLVMVRYEGNDDHARLVGLALSDPGEAAGRLASGDLERVVALVLDSTTPSIHDRSGVVGVSAAKVAQLMGYGSTTSAKNKAVRYLQAATDAGKLAEVSVGKNTTRGVRLWDAPHEDSVSGFEEFWSRYPKQENKAAARTAWKRKVTDDGVAARIIDAVTQQREYLMRNGETFCPSPASWLFRERWEDELDDELRPWRSVGEVRL